jgi:sugar lactone lactonase YvrE
MNAEGPQATPCTSDQATLGEGARWDARRDELLRVDILGGTVHRDRIDEAGALVPVRAYQVPGTVGAIAPIEGDDGWLIAANRGVAYLSVDGQVHELAQIAPEGVRMNDAACDPQGRFWAGTMGDSYRPGAGSLYRLERDGRVETVLDGLTISNGLGWSPDGATMYFADSDPGIVHAFAFDGERGTISEARVLIDATEEKGKPDGLTVDAAGDLWVAMWGIGSVRRYGPDGMLRQELAIPAAQTTSCAFAGPGLHRLYVTTATEDWTEDQRRADPAAGLVYRLDTDATGRAAETFRPDPSWWSQARR